MEIRTYETMDDRDQMDLMSKLAEWRAMSESGCQEARELMTKCTDFANGDQWDAQVKADLEDQGKHVATIPLIRAQVKQFAGHQVSNPKDITCLNSHGGMKMVADAKSALLKHAIEGNGGLGQFSIWFERGITAGRSFIAWMRDFGRDPLNGDLVIKVLPEMDCLWDPTCKTYDPNGSLSGGGDGWKFFFYDEPVDTDWAEQQWPDKAEEFGGSSEQAHAGGRLYSRLTGWLYSVTRRATDAISGRSTQDMPDFDSVRYWLTHCWWVDYQEAYYWYDVRVSTTEPIILIEKKDIRRAKKLTDRHPLVYRLVESNVKVIHHTMYIGDTFLEDRVDEFDLAKYNLAAYPVVPYYPSFEWGRASGIVEDMIGPQESVNWFRSYVINHLKLLPNSGWIIRSDMGGYKDHLLSHSGEAAQVIEEDKCGGSIRRIEPTPFPVGMDLISDKAKGELREVSNIRMENPETDTKEMSGRAVLAKQAGAQIGIAPQMGNSDWSLRIFGDVGNNIIACSGVYSDDEIKEIIEESRLIDDQMLYEARIMVCQAVGVEMPQGPGMPNQEIWATQPPDVKMAAVEMYTRAQQIFEAQMEALDKIAKPMAIQTLIGAIRNPIQGRYTCQVALSQYSVTSRLQTLASLVDTNKLLLEAGYQPLPERDIIEASDLPHKQRLLKERGYA